MRIFLFAIPLFCIVIANAETWECQAGTVWGERKIVVRATSQKDGTGVIEVAGTTHDTVFAVNGFDRAWSWDLVNDIGQYRYAFLVKPSGAAEYFDFRESFLEGDTTASANQLFICRDSRTGELPTEPRFSDGVSDQDFERWIEESLPSDYIRNPDTIADCTTNRDLFRARQLENIIGMSEFLELEAVPTLAMDNEDQAQALYEACVARIECIEELGAEACVRAAVESLRRE